MPPRWDFSIVLVIDYKHAAPDGADAATAREIDDRCVKFTRFALVLGHISAENMHGIIDAKDEAKH